MGKTNLKHRILINQVRQEDSSCLKTLFHATTRRLGDAQLSQSISKGLNLRGRQEAGKHQKAVPVEEFPLVTTEDIFTNSELLERRLEIHVEPDVFLETERQTVQIRSD